MKKEFKDLTLIELQETQNKILKSISNVERCLSWFSFICFCVIIGTIIASIWGVNLMFYFKIALTSLILWIISVSFKSVLKRVKEDTIKDFKQYMEIKQNEKHI